MSTLFSWVKVTTICMLSYYNRFGLLNASQFEDVSENCILFSVVNLFLKLQAGKNVTELEKQAIINYIDELWNEQTQRFNNIPGVLQGPDAYISKDQYVAICAFSNYYNLDYHKRFWNGINFRTYDNLTGEFNLFRLVPMQDYIYAALVNDKFFARLLKPVFYAITAFSFLHDKKTRPTLWERLKSGFKLPTRTMFKTDGQILSFVRFFGLNKKASYFDRLFWQIMMSFCKKRYESGFQTILTHYYEKFHPNHILAKEIYDYGI